MHTIVSSLPSILEKVILPLEFSQSDILLNLGVHVSISGSIDQAVDRAKDKGCTTFQIFTRNPRGWKFSGLAAEEAKSFVDKVKNHGIFPPIAHMPYLPNLASPKREVHEQSISSLVEDLGRCGTLGVPFLVVHLGSHLGAGMEVGLERIVGACKGALDKVRNEVTLVLENTAGSKNSMGSTFEDIARILEGLDHTRTGVCLDTCHAFGAGYDLRNENAVKVLFNRFDEVIGLDRLKVVHLNDSKGDLGSGLDRHEHIGLGQIGRDGFKCLLHHPALKGLPLILETPIDARRDDLQNMATVRRLSSESG